MPGDTRVTAHYHGTVGAVTVAFMGLSFQMLGRLGMQLRGVSWARVQPMIYALGLLLLIAGLFSASNYGGQRKVFETFAHQKGLWGQPVLLTFLYTYCTTACPRILSSIRQSLDKAGAPPGAVEVVAVTVDPERDTTVRLAEYSKAFPATWLFLSGEPAKVARTWASYKIAVNRDEASGQTVAAPAHAGHAMAHGEHDGHAGHDAHAGHSGHDAHAGHAMAHDGQPMDHMGHVEYTITHTNKVVLLDNYGRVAAEHSGSWTSQELAGSVSRVLSGAQGRLDSPVLAAMREFLQRCGAFAVQNPFAFFGIILAIMLPGILLPAFLIRTLLISTRA